LLVAPAATMRNTSTSRTASRQRLARCNRLAGRDGIDDVLAHVVERERRGDSQAPQVVAGGDSQNGRGLEELRQQDAATHIAPDLEAVAYTCLRSREIAATARHHAEHAEYVCRGTQVARGLQGRQALCEQRVGSLIIAAIA